MQVKGTPSMLGRFLVVLGVLGLTAGTLMCYGVEIIKHFDEPPESIDLSVVFLWAAASTAIITTGGFLLSSKKAREIHANYWGPGAVFLIVTLLGFAGWIFAFSRVFFWQ